jgi:hypothetical protein
MRPHHAAVGVLAILGIAVISSIGKVLASTSTSSERRSLRAASTFRRVSQSSFMTMPPPPPHMALPQDTQYPPSCPAGLRGREGITLSMVEPSSGVHIGDIRLILKPEWSRPSAEYAKTVGAVDSIASSRQHASTVYRLEPGFLIQGKLAAPGVRPNTDKRRAPKVMERGEVGWAGGGAGPDFFIYLGTGPASWLGNPHDGTIFAELADEESLEVAANVSHLPMPPTPPGQMHLLKSPVRVVVAPWHPPAEALDVSVASAAAGTGGTAQHPPPGILKIVNAANDAAAAACDPSCHALPRTELHGDVVRWGEKNEKPDAAACCKACQEHRDTASRGKPCNVWVYCGNKATCGKRHRQCWLKHTKNLWGDRTLLVGASEAWTSGTMEAPPADHPSGAGRTLPAPADADAQIRMAVSPERDVSVRIRLRATGAPRAAASVRALAQRSAADAHDRADRRHSVPTDEKGCPTAGGALLGGSPAPYLYGSSTRDDGMSIGGRWPRGAALVRGTLGALPATPGSNATSEAPPSAVEPSPVTVLRGSVCWSVAGGDGPAFFIALADMPHLGVSMTVWADVVADDMPALDALASDVSEGRVGVPAPLDVLAASYP